MRRGGDLDREYELFLAALFGTVLAGVDDKLRLYRRSLRGGEREILALRPLPLPRAGGPSSMLRLGGLRDNDLDLLEVEE